MCSLGNNEFWRDFLKLFRQQPSLWKVNSDSYRNTTQRDKSLQIMLSKLQEVNPAATVEDVKKKLKNLRTVYKREAKKVQKSRRSGAAAEEEYVPRLWYFAELDFLRDQEAQKREISTLESDDEGSGPSEILNPELVWTESKMACEDVVLSRDVKPLDSLETFAAGWVAKLRTMDENQQHYARMAIDQILLQGECKTLSLASVTSIVSASTFSLPQPQPIIGQLQYPLQQLQQLLQQIQQPLQQIQQPLQQIQQPLQQIQQPLQQLQQPLQQLQQPLQHLQPLLQQLQQPQPVQFPLQLQPQLQSQIAPQNPCQPQNRLQTHNSLQLQSPPIHNTPLFRN